MRRDGRVGQGQRVRRGRGSEGAEGLGASFPLEDAAFPPGRDAILVLAPPPQNPHARLTKLVGGAHQRLSATAVRPEVFEGVSRLFPLRRGTQIDACALRPTNRTGPPRPSCAPPYPQFLRTVGGRASYAGTAARTAGQAPLRSTLQGAKLEGAFDEEDPMRHP